MRVGRQGEICLPKNESEEGGKKPAGQTELVYFEKEEPETGRTQATGGKGRRHLGREAPS